jgi:hypothetical protein
MLKMKNISIIDKSKNIFTSYNNIIGKARKTTQHMDTNDLSRETHTAIINTAERFHHDLTLQFGVLAEDCNTDNEFLDESESIIKEWLTDWDLEELIMDIFFDNPPSKQNFKKTLDKILTNIKKVRNIPMERRKFDLW